MIHLGRFEHIEIETKLKPNEKDRPWEFSDCELIIAEGFVTVLTKPKETKESVRIFPAADVLAIGGYAKDGKQVFLR